MFRNGYLWAVKVKVRGKIVPVLFLIVWKTWRGGGTKLMVAVTNWLEKFEGIRIVEGRCGAHMKGRENQEGKWKSLGIIYYIHCNFASSFFITKFITE